MSAQVPFSMAWLTYTSSPAALLIAVLLTSCFSSAVSTVLVARLRFKLMLDLVLVAPAFAELSLLLTTFL